jgi:hypothetical protein
MRFLLPMLSILFACEPNTKTASDTAVQDNEATETDTQDNIPDWVATGNGTAYFLDGLQANSIFTLEMSVITPPPENDGFVGYLVGAGIGDVYLGPIPVAETTLFWQAEANINALLNGYNRFEIRLTNSAEVVYSGQVDPVIEETYHRLLISSPDTPDGDGSLREIQQTLQAILDHQQVLLDTTTGIEALADGTEKTLNTALVDEDDHDKDGTVEQLPNYLPLIGDNLADTSSLNNLRNLVLADLDAASAAAHQISPTHPIKDLANYAYDCTQLVGTYVQDATDEIYYVATGVTTEEVAARIRITNANQYLSYAFAGFDTNENGVIDDLTEGTINCSIDRISRMAYMDVGIAQ